MNIEQLQQMVRVQGELATIEMLHSANASYCRALEEARADARRLRKRVAELERAVVGVAAEGFDSERRRVAAAVLHGIRPAPSDGRKGPSGG